MPVKLSVVNEEAEDGTPSTYLFETDEVTIGRADENHLTLADPKRIVSSEHAMVRREHGTYCLIDRGSKNFTYVGSQRITAQDPYRLSDGDVFRIGDFRIEFHVLDADRGSDGSGEETVFDHSFENPMAEPAERLVDALGDLRRAYREAAPQRRDEVLAEALDGAEEELESESTVASVVSALVGEEPGNLEAGSDAQSASSLEDERKCERHAASGEDTAPGDSEAVERVVYELGNALAKVVRIPWRFRHEFIGQTVMQAPKTQFLYSGDGAALVEHILNPSLSEAERNERLDHVHDAAETLQVHQVAMLNGYKASVTDGVEELLSRLDPEEHRKKIVEENPVFEYAPMLASPKTLDRIQTETRKLQREDGISAETRIFRPAFTKAYLARMTDPGSAGDDESGTSPSV